MSITARIYDRGNGLPRVGEHVYHVATDTVYRVARIIGPIHTGAPGDGNHVWAEVEDTGLSASDLSDEEYEDMEYGIQVADAA